MEDHPSLQAPVEELLLINQKRKRLTNTVFGIFMTADLNLSLPPEAQAEVSASHPGIEFKRSAFCQHAHSWQITVVVTGKDVALIKQEIPQHKFHIP